MCGGSHIATNLSIDPDLLDRALEVSGERTKKAAVTKALQEFIAALDPLDKALVLLYLDGNSYQESAAVLGISETNVATKISRIKQRMRQEFSGSARA